MRRTLKRVKKIAALLCAALLLLNSLSLNSVFAQGLDEPPAPSAPTFTPPAGLTTPEETPLDINLESYFADTNEPPLELIYTLTVQPTNGSAGINDSLLTYTPNLDFYGNDTFVVTAFNDTDSVAGQFTVNVTPVEDAPIAADDTAGCTTLDSHVDIDVLDNDTTVETAFGTQKILSFVQPSFGTVSTVTDGARELIRYVPDPRQSGNTTFSYVVGHAGGTLSVTTNVTVTVSKVNSPPTFVGLPVTVTGNEGDTLEFSFRVRDIDAASPPNVSIGLTIESSNDKVLKNENIAITSSAVDTDTAEFTVELTFEPYANTAECGALSLAVTAFDIDEPSSKAEGSIRIIVASVTDPPVISSTTDFSMSEDTTDSFEFTITDPDKREGFEAYTVTATSNNENVFGSGNLQVSLVSQTETQATYRLTLTPRQNANTQQAEYANGPVTITLSVTDSTGGIDTETVSVTVLQVNDEPTASGATRKVDEDTPITFSISDLAADLDGITDISFDEDRTDDASNAGGTIVITENGTKLTYTPKKYHYGVDSFSYTVIDKGNITAAATVNITLNFVNNLPEFTNLQTTPYVTNEDTTLDIVLHVFDAETTAKTLALQVTPSANTQLIESATLLAFDEASPTDRVIRVKPAANKNSHDGSIAKLKLVLGDGTGETTEYIDIKITPVNDKPTGGTHSQTFTERIVADDDSVTIYASDMKKACGDVDRSEGDTLYIMEPITLIDPENGATVTDIETNGDGEVISFVYTPALYFFGTDEISFVVADQVGWDGDENSKAIGTVQLKGTPVNAPPELGEIENVEVDEDKSVTIDLIGCYDPETKLEDLIIAIDTQNEQVLNRSSFVYSVVEGGYKLEITPLPDQFTNDEGIKVGFTVSDGEHSVKREFIVKVQSMPDAPRTTKQEYTVRDAVTLFFNPLEGCYDPDPDETLTVSTITCVGELNGTLAEVGGGVYSYTSEPNFNGIVELKYTVEDSSTEKSTATDTIIINVSNINVGASIQGLPYLYFFAEQTVPTYTLKIENMSISTEYTLSAEVMDGGPVDPYSFVFNGQTAPRKFTAASAAENHSFTFGLSGETGDSVVRVTLSSKNEAGETVTSFMSFKVTASKDNEKPEASDVVVDCNEGQPIDIDVLASVTDKEDPLKLQMQIQSINNFNSSNATVTIVKNVEGRWVLRFNHSGVHNAHNTPSATFTINYTVVDSGGKIDDATATVNLHSPNHTPHAYLHIRTLDSDDKTNVTISPLSSAYDYDEDELFLHNVWEQNDNQPGEYTLSTNTDGKTLSFTADVPGWYYFNYQVKSSFDKNDVWQTSGTATLMIGVRDEYGAIPPYFNSGWTRIDEDSGEIELDLTSHIYAARDDNGSMNVNVEILASSTHVNKLDVYKIVTRPNAQNSLLTDYILRVKPKANANGTGGEPRIQLKITEQAGTGIAGSAFGNWVVYITPVNDAPKISTHSDITVGRGDYETATFTVTDVDFLQQIDCDKQIQLSLASDKGLVVDPDMCKIEAPTDGSGEWTIQVRGMGEGEATLTIIATDLEGLTCSTSIKVTVTAQNRAPEAKDYTVVLDEDTRASVIVIDESSDPDGDPLKIELVGYTHDNTIGYAEAVGDKVIFTPAADFCHSENYDASKPKAEWASGQYVEVKYKFVEIRTDEQTASESDAKSVWFHVNPINDPPRYIGLQQNYTMSEGSDGIITISVADVDSADLTFNAVFDDSDDKVQSVEVQHKTRTDTDGDANGSTYDVTLLIKNKQYQFHGENEPPTPITLTANDGKLKAIADLLLTITPVNDKPVFKEEFSEFEDYIELTINEDTSITAALTDYFTDPDGDDLYIISFSKAIHGSVENVGNALKFTPDTDYFTENEDNSDEYGQFEYTISDGSTGLYSGTVKILIRPVNDAPRLKSPSYTMDEDTVLTIDNLFSGGYNSDSTIWDVDNVRGELKITGVGTDTSASNGKTTHGGTVTVENNVIKYTPPADFDKQDSFRYTVADKATTTTATIYINITADNDEPRANFEGTDSFGDNYIEVTPEQLTSLVWEFDEDTVGVFNFRVWDPEGRNVITKYSSTVSDALLPKANMAISGTGENLALTLSPLEHKFGDFVLTFEFSDGVNITTYDVKVSIRSVNDKPTISGKTISVNEDNVFGGSISAADIETPANELVFTLASDTDHPLPANGTAVVNEDGSYTYKPNLDFFGYDTFYIKVTDKDGGAAFAKIDVTVNPMNDKPGTPTDIKTDKNEYLGGETATLTWAAADDVASETHQAHLHYEIKIVNTANNAEHPIISSTAGGYDDGLCFHNFTMPTVSGEFKAYIRTIDDGKSYGPPDGTQAATKSDWALSAEFNVDSAKPVATHTTTPSGWTNATQLTITLIPTDDNPAGDWQSGIATATSMNPASATHVSGYDYTVTANGEYKFELKDNAGNISTYTANITNFDRLDPTITATPTEIEEAAGQMWTHGRTVELTFADRPANLTDGSSGISQRLYKLVKNGATPPDYSTYTDAIELSAKGVYSVIAMAVDNAGNVSEEKTFGPYVIINAPPSSGNVTGDLYRIHIDENKTTNITLNLPANDPDGDTLSYEWDADNADYITLLTYADLAGSGSSWTLTHKGGDLADDLQNLTLTLPYTVSDSNVPPATTTSAVKITLHPVNRVPTPSDALSLSPPAKTFKGGAEIVLGWGDGSDHETPVGSLKYELRYKTSETGEWTTPEQVASTTHDFDVPSESTEYFQYEVCTVDDNPTTRINPDGSTGPAKSDWVASPVYRIDAAAPTVTLTASPTDWTNGIVEVKVSVTDPATGSSGLATVIGSGDYSQTYADTTTLSHVSTATTADNNTVFTYTATDHVGNTATATLTVTKIDRLAPVVSASPTDELVPGYAHTPIKVTLSYNDATATTADGKSGVVASEYCVYLEGETPDEYKPYTTPITLDVRGKYYIAASCTDAAGNTSVLHTFGPYEIANSVPVAQNVTATLYEHDVDGVGGLSADIALIASDADTADTLTFSFTDKLQLPADVTLVHKSGNVWTLTYTGSDVVSEKEFTLQYKATDDCANENANSNAATVTVTLKPVNDASTTPDGLAIATQGPYRGGQTVNLTVGTSTDEETAEASLVYELEWRADNGEWHTLATATGTPPASVTLPADVSTDNLQIRMRAKDDNPSTVHNPDGSLGMAYSGYITISNIAIDSAKPTATYDIFPDPEGSGMVIRLHPADLTPDETWQSGFDRVEVVTPAASPTDEKSSPFDYRVPGDGTYEFTLYDNAGNSYVYQVTTDMPSNPAIDYSTRYTRSGETVSVSWTHSGTGVYHYELEVFNGAVWITVVSQTADYTSKSYEYTVPTSFPDTADMAFRVRAWDENGLHSANWSQGADITCDSTPPVIVFTPEVLSTVFTNQSYGVAASLTDALSGLETAVATPTFAGSPANGVLEFGEIISFTENGTLTVTATDRCGNSASKTYTVNNIDKVSPTVVATATCGGAEYSNPTDEPLVFDIAFADEGVSGLVTRQYLITATDTTPTAGWVSATANSVQLTRTAIGTYYLHLKASDGAGNETYEYFGPFERYNTPPVAQPKTVNVDEGKSIDITLAATDADGDDITAFTIVATPSHGELATTTQANVYRYTHSGDDPVENDFFTFTVTDANGGVSVSARVNIVVREVNDPPEILNLTSPVSVNMNASTITTFQIADPDHEADTLILAIRSSDSSILPISGVRAIVSTTSDPYEADVELIITPPNGKYGQVTLTLTLRDPSGAQVVKTLVVDIAKVNLPPVAQDQYYFVVPNGTVSGTINAKADEGASIADYDFGELTPSDAGTLTATDGPSGAFSFQAGADFIEATFPATITDSNGLTASIKVYINSKAVSEENEKVDRLVTTLPNLGGSHNNAPETAKIKVTSSNPDVLDESGCEFYFDEHGEIQLVYNPVSHAYGDVILTIQLLGDSDEVLYTLNLPVEIKPINDPPVVENKVTGAASPFARTFGAATVYTVAPGGTLEGAITALDKFDNPPYRADLGYSCWPGHEPLNGTLVVDSLGNYSYTPNDGYEGDDEFYIAVYETTGTSANPNPATIPLGVLDVTENGEPKLARLVHVQVNVQIPAPPNPPTPPNPPENNGDGDNDDGDYNGGWAGWWGGTGYPGNNGGTGNTGGSGGTATAKPNTSSDGDSAASGGDTSGSGTSTKKPSTEKSAEATPSATDNLAIVPATPAPIGTAAPTAPPALAEGNASATLAPTAAPAATHANAPQPIPATRWALLPWLLGAAAAGMLLLLLITTRLTVVFHWVEGEKERTMKFNRYFPRLKKDGEKYLDITYAEARNTLGDAIISLHFGILCRNRACGGEMEIVFDKSSAVLPMPTTRDYDHDEGVRLSGSRFTKQ